MRPPRETLFQITQRDIDEGGVTNAATLESMSPQKERVFAGMTAKVFLNRTFGIMIGKIRPLFTDPLLSLAWRIQTFAVGCTHHLSQLRGGMQNARPHDSNPATAGA